jgi:hypothetical protein
MTTNEEAATTDQENLTQVVAEPVRKNYVAEARGLVLSYANDLHAPAVRDSGDTTGGPFDSNSYRLADAIRPSEAFDSAKIAEAEHLLTAAADRLSLAEALSVLEFVDQLGVPAIAGPFVKHIHSLIAALPSDSRQLDVLRGGAANEPPPLDWTAAVEVDETDATANQLKALETELAVVVAAAPAADQDAQETD